MDWNMDQTRYTGRPQGGPARDPREMACYDFLDSLGVSYDRVDHDPAFHIETCHQVETVLEAPIAKNLFLCNRQKTQFYLLRVQPGSASLLCLLQDREGLVQLVLDRPLLRQAYLGLHPCRNTSTLRIAMADILERVIPALGHTPALVELPEESL